MRLRSLSRHPEPKVCKGGLQVAVFIVFNGPSTEWHWLLHSRLGIAVLVAGRSIADIMPDAETSSPCSVKQLLLLGRCMVPECVWLLQDLHSMHMHPWALPPERWPESRGLLNQYVSRPRHTQPVVDVSCGSSMPCKHPHNISMASFDLKLSLASNSPERPPGLDEPILDGV